MSLYMHMCLHLYMYVLYMYVHVYVHVALQQIRYIYIHTIQLSTLWCGTQAWKYGSTPPAIPKDWKASLLMPLQRYGKSAWALPRETRRKAIHKIPMETMGTMGTIGMGTL